MGNQKTKMMQNYVYEKIYSVKCIIGGYYIKYVVFKTESLKRNEAFYYDFKSELQEVHPTKDIIIEEIKLCKYEKKLNKNNITKRKVVISKTLDKYVRYRLRDKFKILIFWIFKIKIL